MAEPIRPGPSVKRDSEIPADNEIGDVGGNKLEDTRGLRFGRKGKKGAAYEIRSKLVHAKTEQISTRWKRRSRIDFVVN